MMPGVDAESARGSQDSFHILDSLKVVHDEFFHSASLTQFFIRNYGEMNTEAKLCFTFRIIDEWLFEWLPGLPRKDLKMAAFVVVFLYTLLLQGILLCLLGIIIYLLSMA